MVLVCSLKQWCLKKKFETIDMQTVSLPTQIEILSCTFLGERTKYYINPTGTQRADALESFRFVYIFSNHIVVITTQYETQRQARITDNNKLYGTSV